ncbi:hypothetical protein BF17_14280 [Yersinia similis]|uniref:Uncharacterized protein n=1 Tax=Yersinia similis TaxID=367190 RepID=A0ABN4CVT8_9GAMM|nr:hypothetical protein BF17_14280 [Yersinia similis]
MILIKQRKLQVIHSTHREEHRYQCASLCKKWRLANLVLAGAAAKDTAQQWNKVVISGAYFRLLQLRRPALWQTTIG